MLVLLFIFGEREREIAFDICLEVREGQEKSRRRFEFREVKGTNPKYG